MTGSSPESRAGSDNVFRDLGFPEAEAQNLLLRGDLVIHIRKVIDKLGITQAEAAKRAGITQPRMNDLVKNRTHKFTLDALLMWRPTWAIQCRCN
jgi:predicted XRE-type DNA-binding protein